MNLKTTSLPPGLYIVATPIGNLRDITIRALDTLNTCDYILCEDTRVSGKLLHAHGIKKPLKKYNDHSDERQRGLILKDITDKKSIALISDAGSPLISDPGYKLVRDCLDMGLNVTTTPGASAIISGIQLSGLPSDKFSFLGFLPTKTKARKDALNEWNAVPSTLILYESGKRLESCLKDCLENLGDRSASIVREITKLHEESRRGTISQLIQSIQDTPPKGEIVLLISPPEAKEHTDESLKQELRLLLENMSVKEAATTLAAATGQPRKKLYEFALTLQNNE